VVVDPREHRALIEETARRSGLVWLTLPGAPGTRAAWHLWHEGAVWVLTATADDAGEQHVPGLSEAETVTVTLRSKATQERAATTSARVEVVEPRDPRWAAVVQLLSEQRLNPPDGRAAAAERWAATCVLARLVLDLPLDD
jgi:hypothetical protein